MLAGQAGVVVVPGSRFGVDGTLERFLRVPYALPAERLETAVRRLAQLLGDDLGGQFRAHRGHAVLKPAQRPPGGGGQAVVDVAGHLAQLHQHALHRAQGGSDVLGGLQGQVVAQRLPVLARAGE